MKTYEKVEITRYTLLEPEKLKTLFFVILVSLAVGLIPIVYSVSISQQQDYVPLKAINSK